LRGRTEWAQVIEARTEGQEGQSNEQGSVRGVEAEGDLVRVHLAGMLKGGLKLVGVVIVACTGVVWTGKGTGQDMGIERARGT